LQRTQEFSSEEWVAVMVQVALANQNSVDSVGKIPRNLMHPQSVRRPSDATQFDLPRRKLHEKQYRESLQSLPGPRFNGEEISGYNQFPMAGQELLPGRL